MPKLDRSATTLGASSAEDNRDAVFASWAERLERLGGLEKSDKVLDVDCGRGDMAKAIGERFGWSNKYTGLDLVRADVTAAEKRFAKIKNASFDHLDIKHPKLNPTGKMTAANLKFPVSHKAFDFAYSVTVFPHLYESEARSYLREMYKALTPNGRFFATFFLLPPNYDSVPANPQERFRFTHLLAAGVRVIRLDDPTKAVAFDMSLVDEMFASTGFVDVKKISGSWRGDRSAPSSQDIVIARRKK